MEHPPLLPCPLHTLHASAAGLTLPILLLLHHSHLDEMMPPPWSWHTLQAIGLIKAIPVSLSMSSTVVVRPTLALGTTA